MTNLQTEILLDAVTASANMVLTFQYSLRDGGQDALTKITAAIVHIEAGHRQNYPVAVIFLVGMVVGNQITDIGGGFLAGQFFYLLP